MFYVFIIAFYAVVIVVVIVVVTVVFVLAAAVDVVDAKCLILRCRCFDYLTSLNMCIATTE